MGEWTGRGKGRNPGQPSNSFRGGPGQGSGRPGGQPTLSISGGSGRGGGRGSFQPSLSASTSIEFAAAMTATIKAAIDFGGSSSSIGPTGAAAKQYKLKSSTSKDQRAGSTIKAAVGETHPRVADPEGNFIFTLEIAGIEVAQFKECSGLKSHTDVFELQEGGVNHAVHKLPGQTRWDNIVLRAGVTSDTSLMVWRDEILQDSFEKRRNGSIVMKTLQLEEVRRYNFVNAWPVAWEGPSFDAGGADLAVEMLEIAHHGIYVT